MGFKHAGNGGGGADKLLSIFPSLGVLFPRYFTPLHNVPSLPAPSFLSPFITLTGVQRPKPGGTGDQPAGSWFAPMCGAQLRLCVRKDAGGAHGAKARGLKSLTSASGVTFFKTLSAVTCGHSRVLGALGISSSIFKSGLGQVGRGNFPFSPEE